jgi:hypothetical protein
MGRPKAPPVQFDKRGCRSGANEMFLFRVYLCAVFSILAALCAFIITYGEYLKHFPNKRKPLIMAVRAALAAFAFFIIASLLFLGISSFGQP